ncbi:MAG TPA: DUF2007 domain-containing protein [Chthonomonadaceae bacterium]|nr:DUF2007 domain-containing protein [Chthonomonadaceae bacterium]
MEYPNIDINEELVLVYDAPTQGQAELVCASLQSAGIRAVVQNQYVGPAAGMLPYLGLSDSRGVLVPASEVETARLLLAAQQPTEEELAEEAEADPLTLEEAEARLK